MILSQYTASQWISCNRFLYYWWHPLYLSSTPSQVLWMNHVCPCAVVSVSARSLTWLATLCFGGQTAGLQVGASTHFSACLAQTWGSAVAFVCSPDWPDDYCSPNGSSRDGCSPQGDQWGCWVLGLQRGWACLIGRGKSWKRFIEDTRAGHTESYRWIWYDMIIIKYETPCPLVWQVAVQWADVWLYDLLPEQPSWMWWEYSQDTSSFPRIQTGSTFERGLCKRASTFSFFIDATPSTITRI